MDEGGGTGLPASIEAAWGLRGRPAKGPRPGLSLQRIVEAAVKVADADGLAAISMGRVAAALGAATMSLYRYVAAKDELLALMVDAALGSPPAPPAPDEGWREGLSRWAWSELGVHRRHRWVVRVPIGGPPATPNQVAWLEQGLRCLRGTGLAEGEKLSVILLLTGYVRNYATLEADIAEAAARSAAGTGAGVGAAASGGASAGAGAAGQSTMGDYGRLLARLTDAARFPALHAVIAAGVLDEPDDLDAEFVFGLERVLDGVDALVHARSRARA